MSEVSYAGFWRRLGAVCIDHLLFGAMVASIGFVLAFPALLMGIFSMFTMATMTIFTVGLWIFGVGLLLSVHWLYYAGFEASSLQATPGKLALGLRVCDQSLQRLSLKRSTVRYASHYLSSLILYFGYLISFFTAKRQTLHDLISDSLVVRAESLPKLLTPSSPPKLPHDAQPVMAMKA